MKRFLNLVMLLVLSTSLWAGGQNEPTYELTVLSTNDTHGHPLAFSWAGTGIGPTSYNSPIAGGMAARSTYFNQVRSQVPNLLILDAGDVTTGLVVSNFFQAKPDFLGMKLLGYNAISLGNHEFDNGLAPLKARKDETGFPFLGANVFDKATGKVFGTGYVIVTLKGVKVGVIGLTTPETPISTLPANVESLEFRDPIETLQSVLPEVKSKADFVVVLSHLGLDQDRLVAQKVPAVGLIIGGHSHSPMEKEELVNGVPIFHAYQWGLYVGRTDIVVEKGKLKSITSRPIPINLAVELKEGAQTKGVVKEIKGKKYDFLYGYLEEDKAVLDLLKPYAETVDKSLDQVIAEAKGEFPDTVKSLTRYPRRDDSALSNMITDAMREQTSKILGRPVDVFFQNGGGIRASLPAGPITKKAVYAVLPFDNTIQSVSITGAQILEILEKTALPVAVDTYTSRWDAPSGAFLQVSGLTMTLDIQGKTVKEVRIGGKPLDLQKTYLMATQNFLMTGGDGYASLKNLPGKYETSFFQRDAALAWIETKKTLDPKDFEDNRINLVNTGR